MLQFSYKISCLNQSTYEIILKILRIILFVIIYFILIKTNTRSHGSNETSMNRFYYLLWFLLDADNKYRIYGRTSPLQNYWWTCGGNEIDSFHKDTTVLVFSDPPYSCKNKSNLISSFFLEKAGTYSIQRDLYQRRKSSRVRFKNYVIRSVNYLRKEE